MTLGPLTPRRSRRTAAAAALVVPLAAALALGAVGGSSAAAAPAPVAHRAAAALHYAVDVPVCGAPTRPGEATCMAVRREDVARGTAGSYAYRVPGASRVAGGIAAATPALAGDALYGPHGGFTPAALAAAYRYDPDGGRGITVGVVDWYDDPTVRADLNHFDRRYGLPDETARSFDVVNEQGFGAPLPRADRESSIEISIDVQAVRAVCQHCRIVLVEASQPRATDLAAAEDTAVALGAQVVTNSFGVFETPGHPFPAPVVQGFDHPGVVITASSGDDGWFGYDVGNVLRPLDRTQYGQYAPQSASFPADSGTVVSVGGTSLQVAAGTGARIDETVWNNNGPGDRDGRSSRQSLGASGGGCSRQFDAPAWQAAVAGYAATGCNGKRLAVDVAAVGDPQTGFDAYDSFAPADSVGWQTYGGTSLSSPIVAGMYALARGANGQAYPARALYENHLVRPAALHDVTTGGNGWCGGVSPADCSTISNGSLGTTNPNIAYQGLVDCSFARYSGAVPAASDPACNAAAGYDGPSGVGTPNGLNAFRPTVPVVSWTTGRGVGTGISVQYRATVTDPVHAAIVRRVWTWGDGTTTVASGNAVRHTFTRAGTYRVALAVTDAKGQRSVVTHPVTLGAALRLVVQHPAVRAGVATPFSAAASSDPNTGASVRSWTWRWGDATAASHGVAPSHTYRRAGTHTVTLVAVDTTGVRTTRSVVVRVR